MIDEIDFATASSAVRVAVMGVGSAGITAIEPLTKMGERDGLKFIAVDTDALATERSNAQIKLQIGAEINDGLGTGENADLARKAVVKARRELKAALGGVDLAIIVCGMGGGMGLGAVAEIAELLSGVQIQKLVVASLPNAIEGELRMQRAEAALKELRENGCPTLVLPCEGASGQGAENFEMLSGFSAINEHMRQLISSLLRLVILELQASVISVDFADFCSILSSGGTLHFGEGRGNGETKCLDAVLQAVESAPLGTSLRGAMSVFINMVASPNVGLGDAEIALECVRGLAHDDAEIILGFDCDADLTDEVRVTVLASMRERPLLSSVLPPSKSTEEDELDALASLFRGDTPR